MSKSKTTFNIYDKLERAYSVKKIFVFITAPLRMNLVFLYEIKKGVKFFNCVWYKVTYLIH